MERSQQTPGSDISQRRFGSKHNQPERARGPDSWWGPAGGQVIEGVVMTWLWPEGCRCCSQKAFKENCVELLLFLSPLSSLLRGDGFTSVPEACPMVFIILGVWDLYYWVWPADGSLPHTSHTPSNHCRQRSDSQETILQILISLENPPLIWPTNMPTLTDRIQWLIPDKGVSVRILKAKRS